MIIVDAHCDTLTTISDANESLLSNRLHWDVERAMKYGGFIQVMAIFQNPDKVKPTLNGVRHYIREAEKWEQTVPFFILSKNYMDIKKGLEDKKVCGLLAMEGGEALEGKIENLDTLYHWGIRCITLTWNNPNDLGNGAEVSAKKGLTLFGREVVRQMQKKGMLVDVSHANEQTFWDCMEESTRPVIASHSNARSVYDHPRNLYDHQIRAIAKTGGVIGVNFYSAFIDSGEPVKTIHLIKHIEHLCGVAGENSVGLGTDFDGMDALPYGIYGVQDLDRLFNELSRLNYSDSIIHQLAGENFIRVFHTVLPAEC